MNKAQDLRNMMALYPTGVCVITALVDDMPQGFTVGSFGSISLEPPLVGFYAGAHSETLAVLARTNRYSVNILAEDQGELARVFSQKGIDRFVGYEWTQSAQGCPVLPGIVAAMDCTISKSLELGDHWLVVGQVEAILPGTRGRPLVFYERSFHTIGPRSEIAT